MLRVEDETARRKRRVNTLKSLTPSIFLARTCSNFHFIHGLAALTVCVLNPLYRAAYVDGRLVDKENTKTS